MRAFAFVFLAFVVSIVGVTSGSAAEKTEKRIAFVVGNESYAEGALPTAANDAGLIAQTLQAAGFEVVGARDLDAETLRQSYADFLKKLTDAGPDTVAFVYLSGYGLQYGNDNYYVPIGANVSHDTDIPIETVRLSDLTGPLVALNLKARFMVFDAAYKMPFKISGSPLAGGFSLVDAAPGSLVAYNSAPGTVAPVGKDNYGVYAQSLAAMLREGGLTPDEIFDRVRLRVNDQSKGAEVPWDTSKIDTAFRFFDRGKGAPPPVATAEQATALVDKPLKEMPVQQAYTAAVARDSIQGYEQFDAVYGGDPLAKRIRVLLAARREAITWRRTIAIDTPPAYWSYLARYPHGPHAYDARLRLQQLAAAEAPPADYSAIAYDVGPPPPDELGYIDQPYVYFDAPEFAGYPPPPPPPDYWLPPVPVAFLDLPPPPPPLGLFFLPIPAFIPLPVYYDPPVFVAYPAGNYFYGGYGPGVPYDRRIQANNIHQGFPGGGPRGGALGPGGRAAIAGAAIGAAAVALPTAALVRTNALQRRGITTPAQLREARAKPGGLGDLGRPGNAAHPAERNALPGEGGRGLPKLNNGAAVPGARGAERAGAPGPGARPSAPSAKVAAPAARPGPAGARPAATGRRPGAGSRDAARGARPGRAGAGPARARAAARPPKMAAPPRAAARPVRVARPAPPRAALARPAFRAPPQARPGGIGGGPRPGAMGRPGGFGGGPRPGPMPHPGGGGPRPGGAPHLGGGGGRPRL